MKTVLIQNTGLSDYKMLYYRLSDMKEKRPMPAIFKVESGGESRISFNSKEEMDFFIASLEKSGVKPRSSLLYSAFTSHLSYTIEAETPESLMIDLMGDSREKEEWAGWKRMNTSQQDAVKGSENIFQGGSGDGIRRKFVTSYDPTKMELKRLSSAPSKFEYGRD